MVGGFNPFGYHVVNVALHGAVIITFARICRHRLQTTLRTSLMSASLFAIHSIHTEAVLYSIQTNKTKTWFKTKNHLVFTWIWCIGRWNCGPCGYPCHAFLPLVVLLLSQVMPITRKSSPYYESGCIWYLKVEVDFSMTTSSVWNSSDLSSTDNVRFSVEHIDFLCN